MLFQLKLFSGLGLPSSSLSGYVATVQLPHKTPLHTPTVGKVKLRKEWAKRSAALRVVEMLHKLGELEDSLKVKKKDVVVIDDYYEDESDDEGGARGNRKFYRHKCPHFWQRREILPCTPTLQNLSLSKPWQMLDIVSTILRMILIALVC